MAHSSLPLFDFAQRLPAGFHMPARMTLLPYAPGKVALVSPIPLDDTVAEAVAQHGTVDYLIAPNLLHHLYLAAAQKRYPAARTLAPHGLRKKRPQLKIDADLEQGLPAALAQKVDMQKLEGAPSIDEFVFFHRDARALVVTDLVFNIVRPEGLVANLVLFLTGARGRLAHSRVWMSAVRDKTAFGVSLERVLGFPFETLVVAHGDIVRHEARARLAHVLRKRLPSRHALPVSG